MLAHNGSAIGLSRLPLLTRLTNPEEQEGSALLPNVRFWHLTDIKRPTSDFRLWHI